MRLNFRGHALHRIEQANHFLYLIAVAAGQHGLHVIAAGSLAFIVALTIALEFLGAAE